MSADDFQTKYASVMESILKTAVEETTKLFETMVDELKAEISRMKKENDDLKTRCSQYENGKNQPPVHTRESEPAPHPSYRSEKRDTAVQCDLVSLCTLLVEQSQPLACSPQQNAQQQRSYEMIDYSLHDHTYDGHREENSHLAFTPLKEEEPSDDYSFKSPIKEEDVEPAVAGGSEDEGPRINQVFSAGEMPEKDNNMTLDLPLDLPPLQRDQKQSSEPEHPPVITANNVTNDETEEQFVTSEEQPLMTAQQKSMVELEKEQQIAVLGQCNGEMSINEQTVPQQECGDMRCTREQIIEPITQNKQITFEEVKNVMAEDDGSFQPVRRKRGRPPKKAKRVPRPVKETLISPPNNVITKEIMETNSSVRLEEVEGSSDISTANTAVPSPQDSSVMLKKTLTNIAPSAQERVDTKDVVTIEVGFLPSSVLSLTSVCSSEKDKLAESQQFMEKDASFIKVSSVSKILNPLPEKSQVPPVKYRERCSSVTLQDAMLLVEAMNQRLAPSPHTHCASHVGTSQTVDKVPAEPQTLPLSTEAPIAASSLPMTEPSTKQSPVQTPCPSPWVTNSTYTTEALTQIEAAIPNLAIITPFNITEALTQIKPAIPNLPMVTPSNVTEALTQIKDAIPKLPMVTPSNITEAQTQIRDTIPEFPIVTLSNITEAQAQIKDAIPELPMVTPSNITEAQIQIKDAIPEVTMDTLPNITETQTQIKAAVCKLPMVTPSNISEAQTQIKNAIPEPPMVTPSNIAEAQTQIKVAIQKGLMETPSNTSEPHTHIKAAIQKVPMVTPSNITAPQTPASVATKGITRPVIRLLTPSKLSDTIPNKIIVVPRFSFMPKKKQHFSFGSNEVTAKNVSLQQSSTAAGLCVGTPSLSSLSQKVRYVTSQKMLSIIPPRLTSTLKGQQPDFLHSRKLIVIPNNLSVVPSEKHQSQSISHQSKTVAPPTKQESVESAHTMTLSSTKLISSSPDLTVHMDAQTADDSPIISHMSNNTIYTCGSLKQSASISVTNSDTEPCYSSKMLLSSGHPGPSSLSPVEKILSPVVRLTRLPVSVLTKDSVSVSELLSNGYPKSRTTLKESVTQVNVVTQPSEMPVVTSLKETSVFVSVNASQTFEEKSNIQAVILVSSETSINVGESCVSRSVQTSLSPKVSSPGLDISEVTSSMTKPSTGEPTSTLEEELLSNAAQDCTLSDIPPEKEKRSSGLIMLTSIPSKDTSDPHLQMTKTQFLAQLAVTPTFKAPLKASSERDSSAETSTSGKRSSLMSRLRSHFKVRLQTRRNEPNLDPCTETDMTTVSPKILKLENHNIEMTTSVKSGVEEDVAPPSKTAEDPIPKSPQRSKLSEDAVRPNWSFSEPTQRAKSTSKASSKNPRKSCSGQDCVGPKKLSFVSPQGFGSTKDFPSKKTKSGAICKNAKSTSVCPRSISLTSGGTSPKQTESTTVSTKSSSSSKNAEISSNPGTSCLSETGLCFKLSSSNLISETHTRSTSTQVIRQIKTESGPLSPIMIPTSTALAETKSESVSPSIKNEMADGDNPRKTMEATPSKKPRMIQDVASSKQNLRTLNAKKIAAAKMMAKMNNSNRFKLRNKAESSKLRKNLSSCEAVKICQSKAVWIPPNITQTKDGTLPLLPVKKEASSLLYLPSVPLNPIPVKAPPVVSPLEPLSVIGGRLLKNQCGECGRILSSSAALESHVSLHTGRRPFSCTLCGKGFPDSKSLKRHGRVHRNGKIHICHECGKGFVYRFSLSKHLQMVHRKIKPFVCQICRKSFFTRRDVESHIRTHTGEKPFQCNLCERKFTRRVELNVHLRWHNGEKRHWCSYCGKGFLDLNNLKRHKYIHTGEKPHSCPHCSKKFTQSAHLKKHVKNVHKILCGGT